MTIRMLMDWLFATLAFAMIAWAGQAYLGGDPELWRLVFIVTTGAFVAGHWNGHCLGRRDLRRWGLAPGDRLDRDLDQWVAREHWRG
jgi:hypothetical protein